MWFKAKLDPKIYTHSIEINTKTDITNKRKTQFEAGRLAAREALKKAGFNSHCELSAGPNGAPVWPDGWRGSITHTNTFAAAAVCKSSDFDGIGIDVEDLERISKSSNAIEQRMLSENERGHLRAALALNSAACLAVLFSAKESIFKCYSRHMEIAMRSINLETGVFTFDINAADLGADNCIATQQTGYFSISDNRVYTAVWIHSGTNKMASF